MATAHKAKKQKVNYKKRGPKAHAWVFEKYRTYLPTKRYYRWMVWIGGGLLVLLVTLQLIYPYGRGLPFASVAGHSVRLATHEEMAKIITNKFNQTRIKVAVDNVKSIEFDLKSAGAEPNTEVMIEKLSNYPIWQRLIPGSILWKPAHVELADVYYANQPFTSFIAEKTKELNFPPQNARLAIKDGKLTTDEAVEGSEVKAEALLDTISRANITLATTTTIQAPAKRIKADRHSRDLKEVQVQAEAVLAHTVAIIAGDKTFTPSAAEVASWVVLNDANGKVTLSIDKAKIKTYLETINKEVETPAGQTNITIVDGRETGRTTGVSGRVLDIDVVADQLATAVMVEPREVKISAPFKELPPSVIYNSKYTATQAGLQAYADDLARTRNIRISIQQLDGGGWTANARAYESTPSGSTYKLYVALVLFDKMEKGEIHWDDPMLDTTVAGCFERMTVASTNPCAEAWIAQFGRQYINDFIHARGFSGGTTFTAGDANRSTAADLTKYMIGLNSGSLVSGAYRDRLLNSLGRHPYRYGIPTGSQGIVHDKVGFLWDYIHDTAIVQHPRGAYVMSVMTKGYSYATIASITREVERIMYP
jgi:vancomycin resistance protein YoaR